MIRREEYDSAVKQQKKSQEIINQFHKEQAERFSKRMANNPIFTDEELRYSAKMLCPCGYGLAYPKSCGAFHYWDCSAILKGTADDMVTHTSQLPFNVTNIKSESESRGTTRGVCRPKES